MNILLLLYLVVLSIYDYREKKVPVLLLYAGGAVLFTLSVLGGIQGQHISRQLLGGMPGGFLLLVAFATKKAGYADGIVLMIAGTVLGIQKAIIIFGISLMLISAVSMFLLFMRRVSGSTRIPYLPFVTAAYLVQQALIA